MKEYLEFIDGCVTPERGHKHHINPLALGGKDVEENKVYLSYTDHQQAHILLANAYPEGSNGRKVNLYAANFLNSWVKEPRISNGMAHSEETKELMSESAKARKSNGFRNKTHSEETKLKMRNALLGNKGCQKQYQILLNDEELIIVDGKHGCVMYCRENKLNYTALGIRYEKWNGYEIKKVE